MTLPDVLTAAEVAERLRVSEWLVYELARRGELPARHLGRCWRFPRQAFESWLEARPEQIELPLLMAVPSLAPGGAVHEPRPARRAGSRRAVQSARGGAAWREFVEQRRVAR